MPKITGFIGVVGSGKTYRRDALRTKGFIAIDFKDALIDMVEDLVGFPIRNDYEGFKERIIGMPNAYIDMLDQCPEAMTGRRLLQRLGTEVMRKRDPNYWVNAWTKRANDAVNGGKSVVVADVRFQNEIDAIEDLGKKLGVEPNIVFCDYRSDRYDATSTHPSEALAQDLLQKGYKDGDEITL